MVEYRRELVQQEILRLDSKPEPLRDELGRFAKAPKRPYENRPSELLKTATPGVGSVSFQPGASLSPNEQNAVDWMHDNLGGDIIVRAESGVPNVPNPDIKWRGELVDIKHISGNSNTLDTAIRIAMRQTNNNGAFIDISGSAFSDAKAIDTAARRLSRRGGNYVILIRDGVLVGYINS